MKRRKKSRSKNWELERMKKIRKFVIDYFIISLLFISITVKDNCWPLMMPKKYRDIITDMNIGWKNCRETLSFKFVTISCL
jgi:hypothetical protein